MAAINLAPSNITPGTEITELINADHRKFETLYKEYQSAPTAEMKQKIAWTFIREVAMHSSAEEEVMYPEVRKRLGDAAADELLKEHTDLKYKLYEANTHTYEKNAAEYDAIMADAMKILNHHIKEEEHRFWPEFRQMDGVDHETLVRLGERFVAAKGHAVTRPHPWAPDKPPMNIVANMATAPLDAIMDRWRFAFNVPNTMC